MKQGDTELLAERHRIRAVMLSELQATLTALGIKLDPLQHSRLNARREIAEEQARAATQLADADRNARSTAEPIELVPGFVNHRRGA